MRWILSESANYEGKNLYPMTNFLTWGNVKLRFDFLSKTFWKGWKIWFNSLEYFQRWFHSPWWYTLHKFFHFHEFCPFLHSENVLRTHSQADRFHLSEVRVQILRGKIEILIEDRMMVIKLQNLLFLSYAPSFTVDAD